MPEGVLGEELGAAPGFPPEAPPLLFAPELMPDESEEPEELLPEDGVLDGEAPMLPELPGVLVAPAPLLVPELSLGELEDEEVPLEEGAVELPVLSAFGLVACLRALCFLVVVFFAGFSVPVAVLSLASAPELVAPCCCIRISSAFCSMAWARAGSVLS